MARETGKCAGSRSLGAWTWSQTAGSQQQYLGQRVMKFIFQTLADDLE